MLSKILLLPVFACCALVPFVLAATGNFTLYAYGSDSSEINGPEVFFSDGGAQIGNFSSATTSNTSNVVFTIQSGELLANPVTDDSNATWSNLKLTVPANSGSSSVNFTNSNGAAGEWLMYGPYVFLYTTSGDLISLFYANPTDTAGVYDLLWDLTAAEQEAVPNAQPVALRTVSPESD